MRHRGRTRLDVALMLGSLGIPVLFQFLPDSIRQLRWTGTLSSAAVMAQPYLLLRLVEAFRPIRRSHMAAAIAGMVLSWVGIVFYGSPLPTWFTLAVVLYFILIETGAVIALVQSMLATRGATRWRLGFAASGSAFLAGSILLAGAAAVSDSDTMAFLGVLFPLFSAVSYYIGFVPPSWLRRAWQLPELHRFLLAIARISSAERSAIAGQELCRGATRSVGALASVVALWDEGQGQLRVETSDGPGHVQWSLSSPSGVMSKAWRERQPATPNRQEELGPDEARIALDLGAAALLAVPIQSSEQLWGVLGVFRRRESLFPSDDLTMLGLLCDQYAVVLDNAELVAQQKRLTSQLEAASKEQLSSIYNTVGDVIFVLAVERAGSYRFSSVNQAFETTTGINPDLIIGRRVEDVIPEPSLTMVLGKYIEAIREKKVVRWEETSDYPTGRLTGMVSVAPIFEGSECILLVGAVHDITERKRMEEEIWQMNTELEARVAERTAQLELTNRELEAFTYSVSHDLRAPLRGIDGFSQAVLEEYSDKLDAQGQDYLGRVRAASQFMGQLIDGLLSLSRLSRGMVRREEVDLSALGCSVMERLKARQPDRQVEVAIADGLAAQGDPVLLQVVVENLLGNAWKFSSKRPVATIEFGSLARDGEQVYFVRDNGAGFDMAYVDKLFGPFQRLHGRNEFDGTGIGLATVQRVINRHGGKVWAEGAVDRGATFYFTLPVSKEQA